MSDLESLSMEYVRTNCGLSNFEDIQDADNISLVNLSDNRIETIGEGILHKFQQLKTLRLTNNQLVSLPGDVSTLRCLEILDVSRNQLRRLPNELNRVTSLKELNAAFNNITELHSRMQKLKNLQVLDVSNNRLKAIPASLGWLPLSVLNVEGNLNLRIPPAAKEKGLRSLLSYLQIVGEQHQLVDDHMTKFSRVDKKQMEMLTAQRTLKSPQLQDAPSIQAAEADSRAANIVLQARELRVANLKHLKLTTVPSWLYTFKDLRVVDIRFNAIREIEPEIWTLSSLLVLCLSHNDMQCMPLISDDGDSLPMTLGILNVSHNRLKSLPDGLDNCHRLQQIYAADNELESLPDSLSYLPIVDLFLSENPLRTLPSVVTCLTSLVKLSISCCSLEDLPESLCDLSCLGFLDASFNNIAATPKGMSKLTAMHALSFAYNPLREFPEGITSMAALSELNLDHTGIEDIPAGIGCLGCLSGLQLDGCPIRSPLDRICVRDPLLLVHLNDPHRKSLDLSNCGLDVVPGEVLNSVNLETLDLSGNNIQVLPPNVANLRELKKLSLDGNPLSPPFSNIREAHGDVGLLEMLRPEVKQLDLGNMGLTEVPVDFFLRKHSLETLKLNGNYISAIPESIVEATSLSTLTLDSNQINTLPSYLFSLQNLKSFMCSSNSLESISHSVPCHGMLQELILSNNSITDVEGLSSLTSLKTLCLDNNKLTSLPHGFGNLTNLETLEVSCNQCATMPTSLQNLQKLSSFRCAENMLTSPPEFLYSLESLHEIDLAGNLLLERPARPKAVGKSEVRKVLEDLRGKAEAPRDSDDGNEIDLEKYFQQEDTEPKSGDETPRGSSWMKVREAVGIPEDPFYDRDDNSGWDKVPLMDLPTIMAALGGDAPSPPPQAAKARVIRPRTRSTYRRINQQTIAAAEVLQHKISKRSFKE